VDLRTVEIICRFSHLTDRVIKNIPACAKDKQAHQNIVFVHYQSKTSTLSLCPSVKSSTIKSNKINMCQIEDATKTIPEPIDFKGTFSHSLLTSLCKITVKLYFGIIVDPRPMLSLKTFFRELSLPHGHPLSYFEVFLQEEDNQPSFD